MRNFYAGFALLSHSKEWTRIFNLNLIFFCPFSQLSDLFLYCHTDVWFADIRTIHRDSKDFNIYVLNTCLYIYMHIYLPSLLLKTEALTNLFYTNKWRATWVTGFSLYLQNNFRVFASRFKPWLHIITGDSKAHICR